MNKKEYPNWNEQVKEYSKEYPEISRDYIWVVVKNFRNIKFWLDNKRMIIKESQYSLNHPKHPLDYMRDFLPKGVWLSRIESGSKKYKTLIEEFSNAERFVDKRCKNKTLEECDNMFRERLVTLLHQKVEESI